MSHYSFCVKWDLGTDGQVRLTELWRFPNPERMQQKRDRKTVDGSDAGTPSSGDVKSGSGRGGRLTRAENAALTRTRLFEAAIEIVGEYGYAGTTIARITERAKVAQGTFYNYFESRQDLLEQLLPAISARLLDHITDRMQGVGPDPVERERCRIIAFFEFMEQTPHLFKILHEGEVQAPSGFRRHAELQLESYRKALLADQRSGQLRFETEEEIEAVAEVLMGARAWLSARYCVNDAGDIVQPPAHIVDMYMKFVTGGLFRSQPHR